MFQYCVFICDTTCFFHVEDTLRARMRKRREGRGGTKFLRFLQNFMAEKANSVLVLGALSSDSQIFLG